jgi:hypothetical protein
MIQTKQKSIVDNRYQATDRGELENVLLKLKKIMA